jgi:hypothetical protein
VTIDLFQGANTAALWLDGPEDGSLRDVYIANANSCARLTNYHANSWFNVSCTYAVNDGIYIGGGGTTNSSDAFNMFGGLIQSNQRTGIHFDGVTSGTLQGVHFENNNTTSTVGAGSIQMTATSTWGNFHITIQSCVFFGAKEQIITSGGTTGFSNSQNMIFTSYMAGTATPFLNLGTNDREWVYLNNSGVSITDPSGTTVWTQNGILRSGSAPFTTVSSYTVDNGSMIYCSDCKNVNPDGGTANAVCASAGTGAMARREHGAWICN